MSNSVNIVANGDREIVMTRIFDAPRHLVFEALTVPALLERWLLGPDGWSLVRCDIDLKVGGKYRYEWRHQDGREMGMTGSYLEIEPPTRLVQTETFDEDWTGGETLNTAVLSEMGGRTTLTTTIVYASTEARDGSLNSNMGAGVAASYARLNAVLVDLQREAAR